MGGAQETFASCLPGQRAAMHCRSCGARRSLARRRKARGRGLTGCTLAARGPAGNPRAPMAATCRSARQSSGPREKTKKQNNLPADPLGLDGSRVPFAQHPDPRRPQHKRRKRLAAEQLAAHLMRGSVAVSSGGEPAAHVAAGPVSERLHSRGGRRHCGGCSSCGGLSGPAARRRRALRRVGQRRSPAFIGRSRAGAAAGGLPVLHLQ